MRVIVSEEQYNKLYNIIYDFIDSKILNIIGENKPIVNYYDGNFKQVGPDSSKLEMVGIDFHNSNLNFLIYLPTHFINREVYREKDYLKNTPIIQTYGLDIEEMENLFGNRWEKPFFKWIKNNIPEVSNINIKSYHR